MVHLPGWDKSWFAPTAHHERIGPKDVHESQRAAMPSREDFDASPDYPLVMTPNPAAPGQVWVCKRQPVVTKSFDAYARIGCRHQHDSFKRTCSAYKPVEGL